jgi:hypothetical protein
MHSITDGYCKYHTGNITYNYTISKVEVSCCNATSKSEEGVMQMAGCVRGKHHSQHHVEHHYTNYVCYMRNLVSVAKTAVVLSSMIIATDGIQYTEYLCIVLCGY